MTRDRSTEHTNTITNTLLLQDPRQVDRAHKYHYKHNALTRPETGRPSTQIPLQTQCSYKTQDRSTEHTNTITNTLLLQDPRQVDRAHNTITNTMLLQDPRQVDRAHKYHYKHNALTRPETGRPIPLQTQCSYKNRDRSTEHTNTITNTMLLQDPRQVDRAHKYHYKHNALTRPETGRPSTQIPLQTQCSYKTRDRSTEHTNTITNTMLLQEPRQVDRAHKYHYKHNALTRPETGRQSTQIPLQTQCSYKTRDRSTEHTNTITNTMLLQEPRQVDRAHKYHYKHNALTRPETGRPSTQIPLQTQCSYKTRDRSTEHTNTITNTMLLQDPREVD